MYVDSVQYCRNHSWEVRYHYLGLRCLQYKMQFNGFRNDLMAAQKIFKLNLYCTNRNANIELYFTWDADYAARRAA